MESLNPSVLHHEINLLAEDVERLLPDLREQLNGISLRQVESVSFVGSGDSHFAGMSTAFALRELFKFHANAITAFEFLSYPKLLGTSKSLVVAVSASGNTPRVVQALSESHRRGAITAAVTSNPNAALCKHADFTIVTEFQNKESSPSVRTHQATLLSLFLIGMSMATDRGRLPKALAQEFDSLGDTVFKSVQTMRQPIMEVVESAAIAPAFVVAGSGPNRGTALYAAAKFVESLGRLATGVDIDEWSHVERHVMNPNIPVILIAPPGKSIQRAIEVADIVADLGQPVFVVTDDEETRFSTQVNRIPMCGRLREPLSPLLYYIFAPMLAGLCAEHAGTKLFPNRVNHLKPKLTLEPEKQ